MSSRELLPNYDPDDDPFYGLGYTADEQAAKLHYDHEQQLRQVRHVSVRPVKRSGHVRSTESDRDTIPEQQPTGGEPIDRQRGLNMIDLHTRERIELLEASYELVHPDNSESIYEDTTIVDAAKIVSEIEKQQKRRRNFGLAAYSSLTIDAEMKEPHL